MLRRARETRTELNSFKVKLFSGFCLKGPEVRRWKH